MYVCMYAGRAEAVATRPARANNPPGFGCLDVVQFIGSGSH